MRDVVILLLVCAGPAARVFAQLHPMPGSKNEPSVLCTGCKGSNYFSQLNDGLKTYPYSGAIKDHVGRYVDSTSTPSFQAPYGFRTARARTIRTAPQQRGTAPPRIYVVIGSAIAAYPLEKFFSQMLPGGMVSIKSVNTGISIGGFGRTPPEDILMWDGFVYPDATTSGWYVPGGDKQDNIGTGAPIDFDDRGYVYAAYSYTGWGIVKDDGRTNGGHFPTIVQLISGGAPPPPASPHPLVKVDASEVGPDSIVAMKVGSKYYAITGQSTGKEAVWDVTDPASPRAVVTRKAIGAGIRRFDRNDDAKHVAVINGQNDLHIYEYADFVGSAAPVPIYENTAKFVDLSYDESGNLWAAEEVGKIWKFTPAGNSYTATTYAPHAGRFDHLYMHVAAGHVFVMGKDYTGGLTYDARLLKIESGSLRNIDLDGFFKKYYHQAPVDYAQPAGYINPEVMGDVQIVKSGGKTYLMYSNIGIGDVFEIDGSDTIDIKLKNDNFGTVNPHSKGPAGPYPGDIVTFTAPSSNPQILYDVTWEFGNPESSNNTAGPKKSNVDVPHQYTGLNTAAKITQTKVVRAITVDDSQIASQYNLTLKVPTPRVGINGVDAPITANVTGLDIVAGQTFNDASDGTIEGHYANWTIDATSIKLAPNATIPVGDVGPHIAQFQGVYGKYDASFNSTSPYQTPTITIGYTVKPFKVLIDAPTTSGTNVKFTGTPLVASAPTVTAGTWNVTWTFNPGGTSAAAVTTQTTSSPINTIPDFSVPKAEVVTGSTVTLKVEVDPAGLSAPAQAFASATNTMTLSAPDPVITKSGCGNVGSPCTFTASSPADPSMSGWTLLWTITGPSGTKTSTTNPYTPSFSVAGAHIVTLKATKSIFEKTASLNVTIEASLCQPLPAEQNVSITKVGCSSSCAPGTLVRFWPSVLGYSIQACDVIEWNFGSGQGTATGEEVTHTYSTSGTFTVTMKITNPANPSGVTKTTSVVVSGGDNNTCTAPPTPNLSYTGCSTGGCRTTDNITFTAKRGASALQGCDSVSWTFSATDTSSSRNPVKRFSSAGTYTVTAVLSNQHGTSAAGTTTVTVTTPPDGTCSAAPAQNNFTVTFTGPTSGCSATNGIGCKTSEAISFYAQHYYYAPASCDHYEWDFGDSTPKVNTREATHSYGTSGSFPVRLRVYNNYGEFTYTKTVKVEGTTSGEPVPVLTPTTFPGTAVKGRTVTFTATSNMATTTGWTWSFGDGSTNDSSQAGQTKQSSTITHTFARTGTFTVRATARNSTDVPSAPLGTAQGSIVISDAPPVPEFVYLLPVAAHTGGQGGSSWRTDVQIYNPDPQVSEAKPLLMEATFKGTPYQLQMIKSTHIYEDFLGRLLDYQKDDSGAIIITTKNAMTPPQIWTRTYTQTAAGTFGQLIPAIRLDNAGGAGAVLEGKYYLSGLRQNSRYRTNVGFLSPNAAAITATITVYDDRHLAIKQFTRTLQPFQLDPITLANVVPNLPSDRPFSIEIEVPSGTWLVAYASYIDNLSNDPVYLQAVRESDVAGADFRAAVIPGVGHTGAWRSDVTIFNPDSAAVQFDLQYYDAGGNKVAEAPGIVLDPYKFLQYDDVLKQGVLGNAPDGVGMLKIVATTPVPNAKYPMAFARTFNDDGANGTFGQGIGAFAAVRPNVRLNKPALLAGVRNSTDYYTNIGLMNLSDSQVTATVTLLDPITGVAGAPISYTLKPNESIVGQYNGFGSVTSGTLRIEATGNVWAFCSIIDRRTKDPEYVPATPLQQQ